MTTFKFELVAVSLSFIRIIFCITLYAMKDLCHLHLGEQNRQVPGKGCMPWQEIGQALRDIHYEGVAVMEPFVMKGGTIGSQIKVWRDLIPDTSEEALDRDAAGSVAFVRHVFGL